MPTNDFLAFAAGAGANVTAQSDYAALTTLVSGFLSGTAQSAQVNKVLRQATIMSAVLSQFTVDTTGRNAVDDGTTATLLASLKAAVSAQSIGVVGQSRNARMTISAASASGTFTADEVVVESVLGGLRYCVANINKSINLATLGAGGMDTGTAPASGFVGVYLIFNPTTGASALLGVNATAAAVPEVYGGTNMPSGYSASALVGVLSTTSGSLFNVQALFGRTVKIPNLGIFSDATTYASYAAISVTAVPRNAVVAYAMPFFSNTGNSTMTIRLAGSITGIGEVNVGGFVQGTLASSAINVSPWAVPILTPQTMYRVSTSTSGSPTYAATLLGWDF